MKANLTTEQANRGDPYPSPAASRNPRQNLRTALRYALQTDVAFQWVGADGIPRDGRGQTRDISQKGAFVESSLVPITGAASGQTFAAPSETPITLQNRPTSSPPQGAAVKLSISLPAAVNSGKRVRMEVQGRVVRVEKGREPRGSMRFGFAVSNDQVSLCGS